MTKDADRIWAIAQLLANGDEEDIRSLWPTGIPPWVPSNQDDKANAAELVSLLDLRGHHVSRDALAATCCAKDRE